MAGGSDGDGTIKLFQFFQKTYQDIGILPPQSNPYRSINLKKWFILFGHAKCIITSAGYLVFEANSMIEYGMVFYICVSTVLTITFYLTLLWKMETILSFIENCERFVAKSKCTECEFFD